MRNTKMGIVHLKLCHVRRERVVVVEAAADPLLLLAQNEDSFTGKQGVSLVVGQCALVYQCGLALGDA
jgi:hypothetical protein